MSRPRLRSPPWMGIEKLQVTVSVFSIFFALFIQTKELSFFLQSEGRKEATAHLPSMCKTAGGVFEHPGE